MEDLFQVGELTAAVGSKVQGYLAVSGCDIKLPITLINGAKAGKTVVITGGTHGGEYPGIETAVRLARDLMPADVCGQVAIVHPVNIPAFFAKTQYVGPYDNKNLNREYPGKALGTVTERIAYTISSQLFTQADFYLDLHGGDIHENLTPFVFYSTLGSSESSQLAKEAAKVMGIEYVIPSSSNNGAFGCAAAMNIPAILSEIGGCGLWSEEEVQTYLAGVNNLLRFIGTLDGNVLDLGKSEELSPMGGLNAEQTGLWYPTVGLKEKVVVGQKVGEIRDCFGKVLGEYFAPKDGIILYVISSLAINIGDPLLAYC